jgi:ABC exporter DevB family membrane fusion protein
MDAVEPRGRRWTRRSWWAAALVLTSVGAWIAWADRGANPAVTAGTGAASNARPARDDVALASSARVEGVTETIEVGAGVDGVVGELRVREGDKVRVGDVLAVIDRRELQSELSAAEAAADAARQARVRLLRGSRLEDRERADAESAQAEAVVTQAEAQYQRAAQLFAERVLSAAERDELRRNLDVARAQLLAARKRAELVKAPPLPEEAAKADAEVRSAEQRVRVVRQTLEKTLVRSPIDGTVLRTTLRPGESFSTFVPRPILSVADTSRLRVRAEVDERDVGRIHVGQAVRIRGDAWTGDALPGRVARLGAQMGRKTVRTGEPSEKGDRDVLEVLVDLDRQDPRLFVGLRVTALFLNDAVAQPALDR